MTTEARHQAEKMQALLSELESTERALREALDTKGDYVPLLTRQMELAAHLRVRAETLSSAVLAEKPHCPPGSCQPAESDWGSEG